jgi:phosphoglycerate dehydrogenase-like enzyme
MGAVVEGSSGKVFRMALTGDFLNEDGRSAYGDIGLSPLEGAAHICYRFLADHAPPSSPRDDPAYWERLYSMEVTREQIKDVDGLVVLRPWVKVGTFAGGADDLVVIGRSGAGYDKIDLEACTANHVALFNAPHALNHPTASSALMFMLALAKRLPQQDKITRAGRWDLQASVLGHELSHRTLGIIGLGHSGRELVRLVTPFNMRILAHSPHADPVQASALGVKLAALADVFRQADFVSLHVRLSQETRRMIGAAELALMKPTAYFINVARGELVDQAALFAALRDRKIAGAGLDVFEVEPLPPSDPLTQLDNVILTPHWSASSADVWQATGKAIAEGMLRAARGEVPDHVVNKEVLDQPEFQAKLARFAVNRQS